MWQLSLVKVLFRFVQYYSIVANHICMSFRWLWYSQSDSSRTVLHIMITARPFTISASGPCSGAPRAMRYNITWCLHGDCMSVILITWEGVSDSYSCHRWWLTHIMPQLAHHSEACEPICYSALSCVAFWVEFFWFSLRTSSVFKVFHSFFEWQFHCLWHCIMYLQCQTRSAHSVCISFLFGSCTLLTYTFDKRQT